MTEPNYVDLSHRLDGDVPPYPGDPAFSCCPALTIPADGCNVLSISMGSHTGTHVDAPYHFIQHGKRIDELPLSSFIAPAFVVDISTKRPREVISWADLAPHEHELRRRAQSPAGVALLLYTGWERHWRTDLYAAHPFLSRDAAARIVAAGVRLVGIDAFSPDETRLDGHVEFGAHETILGAGGVIAENMRNLDAIREGEWIVHLVPLKLGAGDGSPARAFASRRM